MVPWELNSVYVMTALCPCCFVCIHAAADTSQIGQYGLICWHKTVLTEPIAKEPQAMLRNDSEFI